MNVLQKYAANKSLIKNGDVILFHGNSLIDKGILWADSAYFSHSGVVFKADEHLFLMESIASGVQANLLQHRIKSEIDFCVLRTLRPEAEIKKALDAIIEKGDEDYKYNYWFYLQFLIYRFLKIDDTHITSKHAVVCSQLVQEFTDKLGLTEYRADKLITPQDFLRLLNPLNIEIVIPQN